VSDPHGPQRPSWTCPRDGQPWPCEVVRKQLRTLFLANDERLAVQMAWLMDAAARDLRLPAPALLYRRFVWWTVDDRSPCTRCGKTGHRALRGLPPRFFPCEFKQRGSGVRRGGC
jgi:hypothetical protein